MASKMSFATAVRKHRDFTFSLWQYETGMARAEANGFKVTGQQKGYVKMVTRKLAEIEARFPELVSTRAEILAEIEARYGKREAGK